MDAFVCACDGASRAVAHAGIDSAWRTWQALRVKRAQSAFDTMMEGYKAIGGYDQ